MKNANKNWLSRLFKSFRNSSKKSGYKPQPLRMELLEERAMLNVAPVMTLDSTTYDITTNSPWYIPLTSTDADGDEVYYKVEVLSGDLTCDLSVGTAWKAGMSTAQRQAYFSTRNPYWELTVSQEGNDILDGENSTMLFELFADKAPNTVEHILTLTDTDITFTDGYQEKFYQNSIFHRVIEGFMSQAGGYDAYGNYRGSKASNIADEFNNDLQMNSVGVLAMANTGYKDTGSSQFFVTSERCDWLNFKHSVFGFLIDGQEVQAEVNRQGTNANSTPNPDVVITNAQRVVNYTNSTLTVRANAISGTVSSGTIRVTPYDENGMAGTSQVLTINITSENQVPVFYPIESDYIFVPEGSNLTRTFQAGYATGEQLGYYAELTQIAYDNKGNIIYESDGSPSFVIVPNRVSTNYETGEVTVDCSGLWGDYYLNVYALKYHEDLTFQISNGDFLNTLSVPIVIGPADITDPTSISLIEADDTGIVGDGLTSKTSGLTFTVEGADSNFDTVVYAIVNNNYYFINSGKASSGVTTIDIISQSYSDGSYKPIEYGYGSFGMIAVNAWAYPYWNSGWDYAIEYSDPTPVFELTTLLDTPENLTVSGITSTGFTFNWSEVDNADCYYFEIRLKGTEEWEGGLVEDPSFTFTNMDPNSVFEVRVSAYIYGNYASLSLPSEIIEVQTLVPDPSEILPTPEDLTASGITSTGFNVSWSAVDGADCYYLKFCKKGTEEWIGDFWSNEESPTSCSITNLDPNSEYIVQVSAYNSNNKASLSAPSEIEVRTQDILSAPTNVWAEFDGSQISATWDAVENAAAYSVYYRELGTEQWNVGEENVTALACQFSLAEGEDASLYEVAVMAVSADPNYESSAAAIVLTNTGDMPLMTAALTTWNGRNETVIPTSVNEWEFLNIQLSANPDDVVDQGGLSIVFQYDATLVKPDWANSEFVDLAYSYHDVPLDDAGTTREVTFIAAIMDSTTVYDGLVANIKMIPANPADFQGQAGVAVADESRDLTITVFTDKDKTASEANVINTTVWAVPYDLDDSGSVDVQDFVTFATYFGYAPDPAVKDTKYYCDFNQSGTIETNDFVLFATYYGRSYAKNGAGIAIEAQTKADAVNAQGAAPIAAPAQSEESSQTFVTTILVEPVQDCVLTPASTSYSMESAIYYADVIQGSDASNTLINQDIQTTNSAAADNAVNEYNEQGFASNSGEINALTADSVDLFFDLELFNDDENSDWEDELGGEILPNLLNRNSFTD